MSPRGARLAVLGAAALFSTGGAAIKLADLSAWWIAGLRSLVAGIVLALLAGSRPRFGRRELVVALAYAATMVLFVGANRLTTAASTAFLQATAPLYILLLGPLLLREALRASDVPLLCVLGIGMGLLVLGSRDPQATAPDPRLGNGIALLAGVTWSLTVIGIRSLNARGASSRDAVALGNFLTAALALPLAIVADPVWPTALDWGVVLWLGVFQIGLAYVLLGRGLARLRALEASLLLVLEPVLSPLWAFLVHGERVSSLAMAGGGLILGGIVLQTARRG